MDAWYFDLKGSKKGKWMWARVGRDGGLIASSRDTFRYYLQVLDDARRHGFDGQPRFGPPPARKGRV